MGVRSHRSLAYFLCIIYLSLVRLVPGLSIVKCANEGDNSQEQTLDNLCGDLNKGNIPSNPIGQNVLGVPYPFELIKNKTLDFFSKTFQKFNPTLINSDQNPNFKYLDKEREKRDVQEEDVSDDIIRKEPVLPEETIGTSRDAGGWCDDSFGVFCMLFNAIKGDNEVVASDRLGGVQDPDVPSLSSLNSLDQPMTPCPSAVEYVTPVFAKNYQGVWRYVVQIPYEGYFTQTVEVVKCLSTKCEYLEGSCLASPRWVSLLVAEIYYPDTYFPSVADTPIQGRDPIKASPPSDFNQYLLKRSGQSEPQQNCDGQDELGCYNVRLYYDWFLIPGSCKCWKNDFFSQYTKNK